MGKSCLLLRFADDTFSESYISTIGVDFRFKTLSVDGKVVKLQIWDTAGQERFRTITSAYYRGADGVMLVFDKGNQDSFEHVSSWLEEVNKYSSNSSKMLLGNKCDIEEPEVSDDSAKEFAQSKAMNYLETSALRSDHVVEAFESLARELIQRKVDKKPEGQKVGHVKKKDMSCCKKA